MKHQKCIGRRHLEVKGFYILGETRICFQVLSSNWPEANAVGCGPGAWQMGGEVTSFISSPSEPFPKAAVGTWPWSGPPSPVKTRNAVIPRCWAFFPLPTHFQILRFRSCRPSGQFLRARLSLYASIRKIVPEYFEVWFDLFQNLLLIWRIKQDFTLRVETG